MIAEGTLLAGKYRVERVLGTGGMGYVLAAVHEQLDQRVAVKLLAPELCEDQDAVLRFVREARAAVRIQSEHVARVLDVGELEDGSPYMVMEFLLGRDLAQEIEGRGWLEVHTAIDYILQACEAVAEAHSHGIIHRDLKPANLFLTRRPDETPFIKVLDFGIAKALTNEGSVEPAPSLTAPQSLIGSPAYMSPEQVRRPKSVDTRTDIWSLGAILYEFLTGTIPFQADTPLGLLAAVVSDPMPSISEQRPEIPGDLEAVVAKCLEKRPEDRYQTVAAFAQALAPHAPTSSFPSIARITGILRASLPPGDPTTTTLKSAVGIEHSDTEEMPPEVAASVSSMGKQTHAGWGASQSIKRRGRKRVALAGIGGVAALGLLWFVLQPSPRDVASAEPSANATRTVDERPTEPAPPVTVVERMSRPAPAASPSTAPGASSFRASTPSAVVTPVPSSVAPVAGTPAKAAPTSASTSAPTLAQSGVAPAAEPAVTPSRGPPPMPANSPAAKTPAEQTPAAPEPGTPAPEPPTDPLEGRR